MNTLTCHVCGVEAEPDLGWQQFSNGTLHLRAECRACGASLKYMPQRNEDGSPSEWVRMAPLPPRQDTIL